MLTSFARSVINAARRFFEIMGDLMWHHTKYLPSLYMYEGLMGTLAQLLCNTVTETASHHFPYESVPLLLRGRRNLPKFVCQRIRTVFEEWTNKQDNKNCWQTEF